jgi:hypothetical protein
MGGMAWMKVGAPEARTGETVIDDLLGRLL